ncbi:hypothetical protein NQD34_018234 [Periophthalmus magnuspinnatus]|nr:hypothetical protein NQD34_018234 [Periophthalmus magnuspinnatus]
MPLHGHASFCGPRRLPLQLCLPPHGLFPLVHLHLFCHLLEMDLRNRCLSADERVVPLLLSGKAEGQIHTIPWGMLQQPPEPLTLVLLHLKLAASQHEEQVTRILRQHLLLAPARHRHRSGQS